MKFPVRQFLGHVIPGVIKPMRVMWNEIVGFIFLVLAGWVVPSVVRSARNLATGEDAFFRLVLSSAWVAIMAYFGISSFLRARRISRS
jgi:hypothetical protein